MKAYLISALLILASSSSYGKTIDLRNQTDGDGVRDLRQTNLVYLVTHLLPSPRPQRMERELSEQSAIQSFQPARH